MVRMVVETLFGWPGVGNLLISSVTTRDFPVIQATVIVTAIAVFLVNAGVDVLYTVLNPKLRRNAT